MDEQQAEILRLRAEIGALTAQARRNEEIFRRSHQRYMKLLQAASLGDLFEAVVKGLAAAYELDAVTLVVRDLRHEVRQLFYAENPHGEPPAGLVFVESLEGLAPQYNSLWQPWLGPWSGSEHSLAFPGSVGLRSCALLPLRRGAELIGCINFGSRDPGRFQRAHAADFLTQLADIAAVCLENAVNRSRLVQSGITDVLTGLYNRRYLQHRLVDELARARREDRPLACLMLDVDYFKPVNDRWGHPAGDKVLAQIAHVIREQCRESDIPTRYGGEEFAVLLPGADVPEAATVAGRICAAVRESEFVLPGGRSIRLTLSAGISALRPDRGTSDLKARGERLVAEADVQLYRAKAEGRDRVCGSEE
jgi:two-component system, cell cycle response regulator